MAQDLARSDGRSAAPPPAGREFVDTLAVLMNRAEPGERGELLLDNPLPPAIRSALDHRAGVLRGALRKPGRDEHTAIMSAVVQMLGSFRSSGGTKDDPRAVAAKYVEVLADLPLWAIQRVCKAVERGLVEGISLDFPPSTARLRAAVEEEVEPIWTEGLQIGRLCRAQIKRKISAEESERLMKACTAWLDRSDPIAKQIFDSMEGERRKVEAARIERGKIAAEKSLLAEYGRLGMEPVRGPDGLLISPSLLRVLGRFKQSEAA